MILKFLLIDILRNTNVVYEYYNIANEINKSRDYLISIQKKKLIRLFKYLKNQNSYYKKVLYDYSEMEISNNPFDILSELPIIDKEIIKSNFNEFSSNKYRKYEAHFTGGSTGEPLKYLIDKKAISRTKAFNLYFWSKTLGYKIGDKIVVLGGSSLNSSASFKKKIYHYLHNRIHLKGDVGSTEIIKNNLDIIVSGDYSFLYGYPSVIEKYVDIAVKNSVKMKNQIRGIVTTSEFLFKSTRDCIEEYFNAPLMDAYGARDGGIVSEECTERNGFHFNMQDCIVEEYNDPILKVKNMSELIVTNLESFSFPFIRYRVGDFGNITKNYCKCGSPLYRIMDLQGRTRDIVKTPNGGFLHGARFNQIFKSFPEVQKFQIYQNKKYQLNIFIKAKNDIKSERIGEILSIINMNLNDENITVKISLNEKFVIKDKQKYRTVISDVA